MKSLVKVVVCLGVLSFLFPVDWYDEPPTPIPCVTQIFLMTLAGDRGIGISGSYGLSLNRSFVPHSDKGQGKGREEPFVQLNTIMELPDSAWTKVANDRAAYNYRTRGELVGVGCEILCDGGAGVNSVAEEVVVGAMNVARAMGIEPCDPRYPVLQLEK